MMASMLISKTNFQEGLLLFLYYIYGLEVHKVPGLEVPKTPDDECAAQTVRPVSVGVSSKFHSCLISYHISTFDDVETFLKRERRSQIHGDETLLA
jgi:hypothetical protein